MKVKFTEGPAALLLDEVGRVERGETVEVSTDVGERLLEQGWTQVGKASPKKTSGSAQAGSQTPEPGQTKED